MPNTRRPGRGRGVDLRPLAGEHPQAHAAAGGQVVHGVDHMGEVAAPAVELRDDEHVALPAGRTSSCGVPAGRRVCRRRSRGRGWPRRRCPRPAGRRTAGPATGRRRSSRRGRSRSACVVNGRLRHEGEQGPVERFELLMPSGMPRGFAGTVTDPHQPTKDARARQRERSRPRSTPPGPEPPPNAHADRRAGTTSGSTAGPLTAVPNRPDACGLRGPAPAAACTTPTPTSTLTRSDGPTRSSTSPSPPIPPLPPSPRWAFRERTRREARARLEAREPCRACGLGRRPRSPWCCGRRAVRPARARP